MSLGLVWSLENTSNCRLLNRIKSIEVRGHDNSALHLHARKAHALAYVETVDEDEIVDILTPMIRSYAKNRLSGERFGDFAIRQGWISATTSGKTWYDGMAPEHPPIEV